MKDKTAKLFLALFVVVLATKFVKANGLEEAVAPMDTTPAYFSVEDQ